MYGGMFTFTAKPPEPEIRVCVHFHSQPSKNIHFFITPINPQLLGVIENVPSTVQTLNYWELGTKIEYHRKRHFEQVDPQLLGVRTSKFRCIENIYVLALFLFILYAIQTLNSWEFAFQI